MHFLVGLRLGCRVCAPFTCVCGSLVDCRGSHVLACRKGIGRQSRHTRVNEVILKAFSRAGIPVHREPTGLIAGSPLRPDGSTVVPWSQGRCLAWDVTCPDTLAASYVASSAVTPGHAAEQAAKAKGLKYQQLMSSHVFLPIAIETMGTFNSEAISCLDKLGSRLITTTNDPRERAFMYQRLSIAVQQGNYSCFTGSLHQDLFVPEN